MYTEGGSQVEKFYASTFKEGGNQVHKSNLTGRVEIEMKLEI